MTDNQVFFALLRVGLSGEDCNFKLTAEEWSAVYNMAHKQALTGVIYTAISKTSTDYQPPLGLAMQWMSEAEAIRGLNQLQNQEAARLTKLFADAGRKSVILKGQANARLYRDPLSRQPGDIDIWVDGGKESVLALLKQLGLLQGELGRTPLDGKATASYHHIHLPVNENGVVVEVHFRPSSGNYNPITNRRLQRWLEKNIESGILFALMMQLAHIQRHFLNGGIGLRQICDYYWLLQNSSKEERREVAERLKSFGLRHTAGALMWVLAEVLHLEPELMLCKPDAYHGEWMLREMMEGGNFGRYAQRQQYGVLRRVMESKRRSLQLMRFDFWEMFWCEVNYWIGILKYMPKRIKYRTLSLRDIP